MAYASRYHDRNYLCILKTYLYHLPDSNIVYLDSGKAQLHCYKTSFRYFIAGQDKIYEQKRVFCIVHWVSYSLYRETVRIYLLSYEKFYD